MQKVMDKVLNYFKGDSIAADAWKDKYQMKDPSNPNKTIEKTPNEMHLRLANKFGFKEYQYKYAEAEAVKKDDSKYDNLSKFGQELFDKRFTQTVEDMVDDIYGYFYGFNEIVPQGSIMSNLGNHFVFGSLSNCFGIDPPLDSYGGIMKTDQQLAQLMKRRGGVGTHLNNIRPTMAKVTNASKSSTGVPTYAERYSNTTREVAQEGRRGALMLLLLVKHPDIFRFITMKEDRTKVTGANVSVMFTDIFMQAVEKDEDFLCIFPTQVELDLENYKHLEYNNLYHMGEKVMVDYAMAYNAMDGKKGVYVMRTRAREIFETFIHMSWSNAEPGAAYIDRIIDYSPDSVYEAYIPQVCNPCGEQWFHAKETCRLIAENFFGIIDEPFTPQASINWKRLYEVSYMQQRIGDDLVDLEAEYIDRILDKILEDPEPDDVKATEYELWQGVKELALSGRRTGNGFTALGDMLAALNLPYNSVDIIEQVMKMKMRAELDATIDMAILRGPFVGWDASKEFNFIDGRNHHLLGDVNGNWEQFGRNSFFQMLIDEFPEQARRMAVHGRRNVSWSTVAPTGTVSCMTGTTSGVEPLFEPFYMRRMKINANETTKRVDFVDGMGDSWQEYPIIHPKFKQWVTVNMKKDLPFIFGADDNINIDELDKDTLQKLFEKSPWYGSLASDIAWEDRLKVNSVVQRYTSNSISCTVNLPKDVSQETVYNLYFQGWKMGLKGLTIYRDGSRTGVLVKEIKQISIDEFGYTDATKRPDSLKADYFFVKASGKEFAVIVGKLNDNPYELFAFENPDAKSNMKGEILKVVSGHYKFQSEDGLFSIDNVQLANHPDERMICRFVSGMLRHRMNPKYIADQVDKSEISVVSFGKAIQRVLKAYVPDSEDSKEACPNCGEEAVIYQEGCKRCIACGHSKC